MSDDIFRPGDRFEKYEIVRQIGKGGQGEVYQARHAFTNKRVAVKVLPVRKSDRLDYRERMAREARVMGTVEHENIVAIYDGGFTGENTVFIVMEYLDGLPMRDLVFRLGSIELSKSLTYACSITSAVAALHRGGILHRDLKPENVFVLPGGIIKVIDFGLARLRDHAARTTVRLPNGEKPGIMGTPHYMSPEQLVGENVGDKADVYAIALIFYEMVTGKHVFQLMTDEFPTQDAVTIQHHVTVPRLLGDVVAGVPEDLSRLIARCLAKDSAERPTAAELLEGFRGILERLQRGTEPSPSGRPPQSSRPLAAAPAALAPVNEVVSESSGSEPPPTSAPPSKAPPRLDTVPLPPGYRPQDPSTWTIGAGSHRKEHAELPFATTEEVPARAAPAPSPEPAPELSPADTLPGMGPTAPPAPAGAWAPWVPYKDPPKEVGEGDRQQSAGGSSVAPPPLGQVAGLPLGATSPGRGTVRVETLEPITVVRARRSRSRVEALLVRRGPILATGLGLSLSLVVFFVAMILWPSASPRSGAGSSASAAAPASAPASASASVTAAEPTATAAPTATAEAANSIGVPSTTPPSAAPRGAAPPKRPASRPATPPRRPSKTWEPLDEIF